MAHPLNQPVVDPARRRVVEGYAILQPRVTPNLPVGDEGSAYQRAFSSPNGIDPYSAAVSDVYQDLFGEGSYAGKGIYAVDAFEAVLADRVPDSTLLSHDLFEGVFARAGLASDVEVVESYPARYDVASLRYHRWARGDWQLLPWILGWSALLGKSRRLPAKMPASGRWKMVDNLRRSVTPLTCVLALLAGWALPFDAALVWTLFFLGTIALPSVSPVLASASARHPDIRARVHFARVLSDLGGALSQALLIVTLLAHQAWLMADAVIRTLFRLFITRRNLLQWTPAAQATIGPDPSPRRLLSVDGRRGGHRRCRARRDMAVRRPDRLSGRSFRSAVDRVTRGRALGEPAIERGSGACGERDRPARAAADRAAHLALLRDLRHRRRQHASAGQFPGRAVAGSRPPHLADQSRPLSPLDRERARFRLDGRARHDRAARGDDGDDGEARAISRPFLQLVRYGKPPRPRPAICLFGRQRQSRGTSHRARQRLPGLVRDAA